MLPKGALGIPTHIPEHLKLYVNGNTLTKDVCLYFSATDVAIMMALFKIGRIATARDMNEDSYIDAAGYIACAAECAAIEEESLAKSEKMVEVIRAKYGIDNGTL